MNDAARVLRSKWYWPKFFLENWHGLAILGALVWAAILGLLGRTRLVCWVTAMLWGALVLLVAWAHFKTKREDSAELQRLNATMPDHVTLTARGLVWRGPGEETGLWPWNKLTGWREGQRVLCLEHAKGVFGPIVSIAHLSETDRQRLRDWLRSSIPR